MNTFNKTPAKVCEEYKKDYIMKNCESDTVIITVLTGVYSRDTGAIGPNLPLFEIINCIAYIDSNINAVRQDFNMSYFMPNTFPLEYLDIKSLKPYRFKAKKIKDCNSYIVVEFLGEVKTNKFDNILEEYSKNVLELGENTYLLYYPEREFYAGEVYVDDIKVCLMLRTKEGTLDASESLKSYRKITTNFKKLHDKILKRCAKELVETANDWNDNEDELFPKKIRVSDVYKSFGDHFELNVDGEDFTVFLGSTLFYGHYILYEGSINDDEFSVNLEG